ncbi:DinB family protein [Dyadobacter chenwenxiniae]|uniref:DinB family protein n=1 Tax=Dyadobacter chenwenxiniae TaxID=2906456 RepID=A0A9X1TGL0_9BACT|nr:DinB family protein [Dyadobacter chenwenxiniae]MCF0063729.1 DinB family protein [Dyadobacter chenwenxiniae]UON83404.1 DinB family protein [Dyadobacter chenwenxiniae]
MNKSAINPMPQFFDRYINLVEDIDIFEAFDQHAPDNIYAETTKLTELGDRAYAQGKWTVKDILQHVIDNERIMAYRAMRFSRNDKTILPGYDEEILAANTMASQRSIQDLLQEFNQVRQSTISLFKSMSGEMMLRSGFAYKSDISALALGFVIIGHPVHHMRVIRERYFPLL